MASMVAKAAAYKNVEAKAADKKFTDASDIAAWAVEDVTMQLVWVLSTVWMTVHSNQRLMQQEHRLLQCFQCFGI